MSMFDLNSVEEKNSGSGKADLYIFPGIRRVVIQGWDKGEASTGTPLVKVTLITKSALDAGTEASRDFNFYLSEKAQEMSMRKIKHIVTKVTKEENIKSVSSIDEFVTMLNNLTKGKEVRMKFTGEEYVGQDGSVKERALIGLPDFAEAVNAGAEYPVVSDEDSKLTFDKNNQYDFKKLPADQTPESQVSGGSSGVAW